MKIYQAGFGRKLCVENVEIEQDNITVWEETVGKLLYRTLKNVGRERTYR